MNFRHQTAKTTATALVAAAAFALGAGTVAQAAGNSSQFITSQKSSQVLASSLMGLSIQNKQGDDAKSIGTVTDLIMNKDHQLVGIVVGVGGFLGIGQKSVGIPWNAVKNLDPTDGVAIVKVSKKQLEDAPSFTTKEQQKQEQKQKMQQQKMKQSAAQKQTGTSSGLGNNQ